MPPDEYRKVIQGERANVLTAALRQFDTATESYLREIAARPAEVGALTEELSEMIRAYQTVPGMAHLPPMLCPEPWEEPGAWADRAYAAGGYVKSPKLGGAPA